MRTQPVPVKEGMSIQPYTNYHRYHPPGEVAVSVLSRLVAPHTFDQPLSDGLENAGSNFVLPANIGNLNPAITGLNLKNRRLIGNDRLTFVPQLFVCMLGWVFDRSCHVTNFNSIQPVYNSKHF